MSMLPTRRGFTAADLVSLIVVGLIAILIVGILWPTKGGGGSSPQLKDSTQIRGITQAMIVWAYNNGGSFPLPSTLDLANTTVVDPGHEKDTTANILSLLIFNGNISPEIVVSPRDPGSVQIDSAYQYSSPTLAITSTSALWDPGFRGTPFDPARSPTARSQGLSHQSYAHLIPTGNRLKLWRENYASTDPMFGNRGPTYAAADIAPVPATSWTLLSGPLGLDSNTLRMHGKRSTWAGNIGYNDASVRFEQNASPLDSAYRRMTPGGPVATRDNLFVNEADEVDGDRLMDSFSRGQNAFLRPISSWLPNSVSALWRD